MAGKVKQLIGLVAFVLTSAMAGLAPDEHLLNDYATGIRHGKREFGQIIVVRCIDSKDARQATVRELPWKTLHRITRRITSIPGVNRCLYDLTPKPPATVEYI